MKCLTGFVLCACTVLTCVAVAQADMPGPGRIHRYRPQPVRVPAVEQTIPLVVVIEDTATLPRLEIPQRMLPNYATQPNWRSELPSRTMPVVAGVGMSMAVAGAFFVRRSSRARGLIAAGLVTAASLSVAGMAMADMALPRPPRPAEFNEPVVDIFDAVLPADLRVTVKVVPNLDGVRLVLSKDVAQKALQQQGRN